MSTIDQILGRKSLREDDPPVVTGATRPASMLRKQQPKDKEDKKLRDKARQSSVVASIIGLTTESDEEGIIPPDAKRVDAFSTHNIPGMGEAPTLDNSSPAEPSLSNAHGEELIPPTAALVAPDVTPKVFQLIDPSQVPPPPKPTASAPGAPTVTPIPNGGAGALDTILGRQTPSPDMSAFTAESFMESTNPFEIKAKVAEKLIPAGEGGSSMPEHKQGDGKTIYDVTRRFMG